MNAPAAAEGLAKPKADVAWSNMARLVRRVHMFTGFFLAPWMPMCALSTLVMTHQQGAAAMV